MADLKTELQKIINVDFNVNELIKIVNPAEMYVNNQSVRSQLIDIVRVITQDRDGDTKFTVNDLVLMTKDIVAMTSLITSLILIINSVPNMKIEYVEGETEELVFKLLIYIMFVIVPKQTGINFTPEEKEALLNVCILLYTFLLQSRLVSKIVNKVTGWIKKAASQYCTCVNESAVDNKLPALKIELGDAIKQLK